MARVQSNGKCIWILTQAKVVNHSGRELREIPRSIARVFIDLYSAQQMTKAFKRSK